MAIKEKCLFKNCRAKPKLHNYCECHLAYLAKLVKKQYGAKSQRKFFGTSAIITSKNLQESDIMC